MQEGDSHTLHRFALPGQPHKKKLFKKQTYPITIRLELLTCSRHFRNWLLCVCVSLYLQTESSHVCHIQVWQDKPSLAKKFCFTHGFGNLWVWNNHVAGAQSETATSKLARLGPVRKIQDKPSYPWCYSCCNKFCFTACVCIRSFLNWPASTPSPWCSHALSLLTFRWTATNKCPVRKIQDD